MAAYDAVLRTTLDGIVGDIREDLAEFGVDLRSLVLGALVGRERRDRPRDRDA